MTPQDRQLTERAAQIEALLGDIESLPDPALRDAVTGIVQDLLALYGEGLARILESVRRRCSDTEGAQVLADLAGDDLVSHLLLLHDLHPVDLQTRVANALEGVRPYLKSHGGNVELLGVEDGVAHLRMQGSCHGCPASAITLKLSIEEALFKAAPDLAGIEAGGAEEPAPLPAGFVPASAVRRRDRMPQSEG
ncbi:MAG: NifU family protein [Armatimonadetes bacterium]|nr:NifU family protein [Armatimonadota bacterium]